MDRTQSFYIGGQWVTPMGKERFSVIDPSTEEAFATISLGNAEDLERAVRAARSAFHSFSLTSRRERLDLLNQILVEFRRRLTDLGDIMSREMGAPLDWAHSQQAASGIDHIEQTIRSLDEFSFDQRRGSSHVTMEPIGVVGMITPWNWPINQIVCKVAPALAAGCTMILKPSELAPLNAVIFAEILDAAGTPAGVFNLVHGTGPEVGDAISRHPDIDMVSFTGSTRAGVQVAKSAADTVKRVHQELGGKSPNILLDDVDLNRAVRLGIKRCFANSGQSCNAPTRMLVPADKHEEVLNIARSAAAEYFVGPAKDPAVNLGPVISRAQYERIQRLIESGISEGAQLVAGGPGRPNNFDCGYFVRPTIFGRVTPDMTIAREEIFGPVLAILSYRSETEAIDIANDTPYGLAAFVQSSNIERARAVARQLRVGTVYINYPAYNPQTPFGGYKQSGNGREFAEFGIEAFLEVKGIDGFYLDDDS